MTAISTLADQWLEFANEMTALSEQLCHAIDGPTPDNQRLVVGLLYARAHQSFLSTLILAKRGLSSDALTAVRSSTETAIAIAAVAADKTFIDTMVGADRARRRAWAQVTLEDPDLQGDMTPGELDNLRQVVNSNTSLEARINWNSVARSCGVPGKVLYHLHYRPHSWHAHVGIESLNAYARLDTEGRVVGAQWDPEHRLTVDPVIAACDVLFYSSTVTSLFFELEVLRQSIRAAHSRYDALLFPDHS